MSRTKHIRSLARRARMPHMGRPSSPPPERAGALGANVRRLRLARGLTQQQLAAASGLSRSTIAAVELGKYPSADSSTIAALAAGLGVSPQQLVESSVEVASVTDALAAFRDSPWRTAVSPTAVEMQWLERAGPLLFVGTAPTPEAIARLLLWRREHSGE